MAEQSDVQPVGRAGGQGPVAATAGAAQDRSKSNVEPIVRKRGLRRRFGVSFTFVALLPLAVMGALALYFVNVTNREGVLELERQLLAAKAREIDKFVFADLLGILDIRVGYPDFGEPAPEDQAFLLQGIVAESPEILEVFFISAVSAERSPAGLRHADCRLPPVEYPEGAFGRILCAFARDEQGVFRIDQRIGREASREEGGAFRDIVVGGSAQYVGDARRDNAGRLVMTLGAPMVNAAGQRIGVVAATVSLAPIEESLAVASLGETGYIYLIDREANIIAHSKPQDPSFPAKGQLVEGRQRYEGILGADVFAARQHVKGLGWVLAAEWPVDDAQKIIATITQQLIVVSSIAAAIMLVLSLFVAGRVAKPIRKLVHGTEEVRRGNFDYRIKIDTRDEIEELGDAFNLMAQGLKRLVELKNEFVFVAAHELRTPVTAIKGYLSMALEGTFGEVPEQLKHSLQRVNDANERLVQLVQDLLEIARSDAGRITITATAQDIPQRIHEIIKETEPLAQERKITVQYTAGAVPAVLADADKLREIIANLLSNAIKYNREGGMICISHEVYEDKVVTHVQDTGIGLSEEELTHLFEKFWRSERQEVREKVGTGLGLYVVRELIERMGGKIWAKSTLNEGTTFSFSLPRAQEKPQQGPLLTGKP